MFLNGIFRSLFCHCAHQQSRFARQIIRNTSMRLQEEARLARCSQLPAKTEAWCRHAPAFLEGGKKKGGANTWLGVILVHLSYRKGHRTALSYVRHCPIQSEDLSRCNKLNFKLREAFIGKTNESFFPLKRKKILPQKFISVHAYDVIFYLSGKKLRSICRLEMHKNLHFPHQPLPVGPRQAVKKKKERGSVRGGKSRDQRFQ